MVFKFLGCLVIENSNYKFLLASLKTRTYSLKKFRDPQQNLCSGFLSCHWLIFSSAHVKAGFQNSLQNRRRISEQFFLSQAANGKMEQAS
jgi:hypothetical protein